jgi:hypothetical protein
LAELARDQLDRDQEIRAVNGRVETMNSQQIRAGSQKTAAVGDVDGRLGPGRLVRTGGIGDGVPLRIAGEVAPGHLRPVEVGDEPVVVPHPEHQARITGAGQRERNADIAAPVFVVHLRTDIGLDRRRATAVLRETDAAGPQPPRGVGKGVGEPECAIFCLQIAGEDLAHEPEICT